MVRSATPKEEHVSVAALSPDASPSSTKRFAHRSPSPGRFVARRRNTGLVETAVGLAGSYLNLDVPQPFGSPTVEGSAAGTDAGETSGIGGVKSDVDASATSVTDLYSNLHFALRTLSLLFLFLALTSLFQLAVSQFWLDMLAAPSLNTSLQALAPFIPNFANVANSSAYTVFLFRASEDFRKAANAARGAAEDEVCQVTPVLFDGMREITKLFRKMAIPTSIIAIKALVVSLWQLSKHWRVSGGPAGGAGGGEL